MSETASSRSVINIGLPGTLFIVFVVLRLTDHIDWAWYWVASPLWVPLGCALAFCAALMLVAGLCYAIAGIAGLLKRKPKPPTPPTMQDFFGGYHK